MREILFRGKRADNGEWVYGFYVALPDCVGTVHMIETPKPNPDETNVTYFVDPSTVGQYTGLTDRNGKRIFEGDIVSTLSGKTFEVKFCEGSFYLNGTSIKIHHAKWFTVIGNRWDSPELLEVDEVAGVLIAREDD